MRATETRGVDATDATTAWELSEDTVRALANLNRLVVLGLAGEERKNDAHHRYRLGLALTPASAQHTSRYQGPNTFEGLGVADLNEQPVTIEVPTQLIEALSLPETP